MRLTHKNQQISTVIKGSIILRRKKRCGDGWHYRKVKTVKSNLLGWVKALKWLYA